MEIYFVDVLVGPGAVGTSFSNISNSGGKSLVLAAPKVKENLKKNHIKVSLF